MIYSDWINAIAALLEYQAVLVDPTTDTPFSVTPLNNILPRCIDYVENRLQRDIDFLSTTVTDDTGMMTANSRTVTLPTDDGVWIVVKEINPIISGVKQPSLEPISRQALDYFWPSETSPAANTPPVQWCPSNQSTVLVGPAPDQAYGFEVVGTQRFVQLSSTNTSNFLTLQIQDLYLMLTDLYLCIYQRDFAAASADPEKAVSLEAQYQALLKSAVVEEARKQYQGMVPSPSEPAGLTSQSQSGG